MTVFVKMFENKKETINALMNIGVSNLKFVVFVIYGHLVLNDEMLSKENGISNSNKNKVKNYIKLMKKKMICSKIYWVAIKRIFNIFQRKNSIINIFNKYKTNIKHTYHLKYHLLSYKTTFLEGLFSGLPFLFIKFY